MLYSIKRTGTPRYPSEHWALSFHRSGHLYVESPQWSAHLCGEWARATMAGAPGVVAGLGVHYRRIQLNGWAPEHDPKLLPRFSGEYILQAREESVLEQAARAALELCARGQGAYVLFDPSGGRGLEPFSWPRAPMLCRLGYAGGITPQNVEQVLGKIMVARGLSSRDPFWIDMESGVRDSDDRFCLWRVREVLERVAKLRERVGGAT